MQIAIRWPSCLGNLVPKPASQVGVLENIEIQRGKVKSVMVEGPAEGKAGDGLDWIARGLERKNKLGDFGNPYPLWTGAPYI